MKGKRKEKGVALLMVIWMVVLLSAISAEFALTMRTDLLVTEGIKEEAEAYYMSVAGYNAALAELMQPIGTQYMDQGGNLAFSSISLTAESSGEGVLAPPIQRSLTMDTGSYSYRIGDEQGKFSIANLNAAPGASGLSSADGFREILRQSGVTDEVHLSTIVDSIMDWTDSGDEHQLNGAEDEWYERNYGEQGMPFPYKTPDLHRLNVMEELLLIRGMTPEILYGSAAVHTASMVGAEAASPQEGAYMGIAEHISVYSRGQPTNRLTADPVTLAIYFPELYDEIIAQRESGLPMPGSGPSRTFSIVATGWSLSGRTKHSICAVVSRQVYGGTSTKIVVSQWNDNYISDTGENQAPPG